MDGGGSRRERRTFVKLPADVAIVTNIDPEHLDHYGTFDAARAAFKQFVENVPFYGFAVMCLDHPEVQALVGRIEDRRVVTYGENPQADVRFVDVRFEGGSSRFQVVVRDRVTGGETTIPALCPCRCLAATTSPMPPRRSPSPTGWVSRPIPSARGWPDFRREAAVHRHRRVERGVGVRRLRPPSGGNPRRAAGGRDGATGRVVAVVQPHRYTRLSSLFEEFCKAFNDADTVIVADVYPAGEQPIPGADRDSLVAGARAAGHRDVRPLPAADALAGMILETVQPATWSSASAPATSPNGPMRCRAVVRLVSGAGRACGMSDLLGRLPVSGIRGHLEPNRPLKDIVWFRAGGPAELLFQPEDEDDLAAFLPGCLPTCR